MSDRGPDDWQHGMGGRNTYNRKPSSVKEPLEGPFKTTQTAKCPIGSNDAYYENSRDNKIGQFAALFVNVRNVAITGTIIGPQPGNVLEASSHPELKGGFTKNKKDGGTNLAVNFTVLPFGRDLLNNIEINQCTSKVWVARKLFKLAGFAWDPRNDIGRHHAGGRVCTLLIVSINQPDPQMQFRCDVSLRNPEVYKENPRIVDLMFTPRIGSGVYPNITTLEQKELDAHINNWTNSTLFCNNVAQWQTRNGTGLRVINICRYQNDVVTERIISDTFYSVDPDVYDYLRDVLEFPEASDQIKEQMKNKPTPKLAIKDSRKIVFDRRGRVQEESPTLKQSTKMVMVMPPGTRRRDNFPANDIRERDSHTSDDEHANVNLCMPTPLQEVYGQSSGLNRRKTNEAIVKQEPIRDDDSDEEDYTPRVTRGANNYVDGADDMNNVDQSTDSIFIEEDEDDDAYEEFEISEVMDYQLLVDRAHPNMNTWKIENAEGLDISLHFRRIIKENLDLKDNDAFWENAFYTVARCELSIQRDILLGNNKSGQEIKAAKGNAMWYSRRYRAMLAAVRHTRDGKISSEEYTVKAGKKKGKGKKNPENNTPLTDAMRAKYQKRKLSGSDLNSEGDSESDECRKKLKLMDEKLSTVTELYMGSKARYTIAEQALEAEKKATMDRIRSVEEKQAAMFAERIQTYNDFLRKKLAAFGQADIETLISPGLDILEGKKPRMVPNVIDIDGSVENEYDMEEETGDAKEDANVSVEETAGDEASDTINGINTLAITTPKSKKDEQGETDK